MRNNNVGVSSLTSDLNAYIMYMYVDVLFINCNTGVFFSQFALNHF